MASQEELHRDFGGVVPEIAARAHLEHLNPTILRALDTAGVELEDIDAIAVTSGPGLAGALVVGVAAAKALAVATSKPVIAVNHLEGHIFAACLEYPEFSPPAVALVVSGGHTMMVYVEELGRYEILGTTVDDAVGEAFDKVARVLGYGFPGGPAIDRASESGNPAALELPRPMRREGFDFSMAGLKTAVVTGLRGLHRSGRKIRREDVAASFQEACVDVLVEKSVAAAESVDASSIVVCGGVAANRRLRTKMEEACKVEGIDLFVPSPRLCTDNGAMIAAAGAFRLAVDGPSPLSFPADPNLVEPFGAVSQEPDVSRGSKKHRH
jgi:N6-L-threonylcarbamoyladenine synthase